MKYRITASLTGNTDDKYEAEIEADSEDEAWAIAYRSQLPRGIYNGKVEELPTRAELITENEQLREALKKMLVVVGNHTGEIIQCDTITERQWITTARALAQRDRNEKE